MGKVINLSGEVMDFESAVTHMDDELRDTIHIILAPCSEQVFFSAYEDAHKIKFKEEWFLSNENPVW